MTTVHMTTGLPASGKTTFARTLNVLRFNLDDYRAMMGTGREAWTNDREQVAISCMVESARAAIAADQDICIDNTHLVPRLPKLYRKEFAPLGVTFRVHDFTHVPVAQCHEWNQGRDARVPDDVIDQMAARHKDATKTGWRLTDAWMNAAGYVLPKPYIAPIGVPVAVIVDIDGTVAIHGDERGHYEYEKVDTDRPNSSVIGLVQSIPDDVHVIFLSGREDRCKAPTEAWLRRYVGITHQLFMRTTGDHRPDYLIKQELFDAHIRDEYHILYVLDDRDQVVKMWREMGLTCLQVAPGNF